LATELQKPVQVLSRVFSLLSFVVVMRNGDLARMMEKDSFLTWFEEWFLYFQWEWRRESTTFPLLKDFFKTSTRTIRRVLRQKLNILYWKQESDDQDSQRWTRTSLWCPRGGWVSTGERESSCGTTQTSTYLP
jgi:hypothetical protein